MHAKYAIAGGGVAGVTAAQALARSAPAGEVHVFGAEPYPYYRRPLLWQFIAGQIEQDALFHRPEAWYAGRGIRLHLASEIGEIEPAGRSIRLAGGERVEYTRLLLATGGTPFVPSCEGTDKVGVFSLRTLDDALAIKEYARGVQQAIVVGGGLVGLETARALHTAGLEVTVVEFLPTLLPRQLDREGAEVLQAILERQGLSIVTGATTRAVMGTVCADCIHLDDGRIVEGDLVLFATGVRSNTVLARQAGLEVNRGIVVDEQLRARRVGGEPLDDVFAAGDAAEFDGRVYGTIPPAIEQARVAAANMAEPGSAAYTGTLVATTLQVAGAELTTLGEGVTEEQPEDEIVHLRRVDEEAGSYRKLALRGGRVVGAILLNDPERARLARQLIERGVDVSVHSDHLLDDGFDLGSLLAQ